MRSQSILFANTLIAKVQTGNLLFSLISRYVQPSRSKPEPHSQQS